MKNNLKKVTLSGTFHKDMRCAIKEKFCKGKPVKHAIWFSNCGYKYVKLINGGGKVTYERMSILDFYHDYIIEGLI